MQRRVLKGAVVRLTLVLRLAIAQAALFDLLAKTRSVWAWTARLTPGLLSGPAASSSAWRLRALR